MPSVGAISKAAFDRVATYAFALFATVLAGRQNLRQFLRLTACRHGPEYYMMKII